jgi:pectin methylesterase-like acyl-CoA thioesterase
LDSKRKAIAENKKIAKKSGNKWTQNINEKGQLVGVNNTIENIFNTHDNVTSADIRKELFNSDNVATPGGAVQDAIDRNLFKETDGINIKIKQDDTNNNDDNDNNDTN